MFMLYSYVALDTFYMYIDKLTLIYNITYKNLFLTFIIYLYLMSIFDILEKSSELTSFNNKDDIELINKEYNDSQIPNGLVFK